MRTSLVSAVLVLATATACGTGSPGAKTSSLSTVDRLAAAADAASSGSSKMDLTMRSKAGGQDVTFSGKGAFAYAEKKVAGQMTLTVAGQTIEERIVGDYLYMKVPTQPGFAKIAMSDLVGTQIADSTNPGSSAKILAGLDDAEKVGTASIHGTRTTHYRGTVDVARVKARFKGTALEPLMTKFANTGVTSIPLDAYLDDDNHLRRLEEHLAFTTQGIKVTTDLRMDLYDFGTKVDVKAPPADQVHDGAELLAAFKGIGGS